jgi:hypothetical protein
MNILGVGEARNRTTKAAERTVPFGPFCHSTLIVWYVLHGHDQDDAAKRRALAPWFKTKTEPSIGHAHQAPMPAHRHPIYANITPTSNNPGNHGSPASLGTSSRITAKVESTINKVITDVRDRHSRGAAAHVNVRHFRVIVRHDAVDGKPVREIASLAARGSGSKHGASMS